jgi:hypothetical protein
MITMARQNTRELKTKLTATSPIVSKKGPRGRTAEGGPGFDRKFRGELFLLAVTNFASEDTFYEQALARDSRYVGLVQKAALKDPAWTAGLLRYLRGDGNMRTASIVGAAEYARARKGLDEDGAPTIRSVVSSVLQRADEPGEILAYWLRKYGRTQVPNSLRRGVGDAVLRLGTEFNYLKWDGEGRGVRFADVLNLTHPGDRASSAQSIRGEWQHDLFGYAVKAPHQQGLAIPESLTTLTRRAALAALPVNERRAALEPLRLKEAGMTWEALAGWLQGPMDRQAWEAIIPNMGIMALLRNLRNFDQAGVSDAVAAGIIAKLQDPEVIAKSRQLPMRFLSAYRAAPSLRWSYPLEVAMGHSLANIPELDGDTQIYVDTSSSMRDGFSKDGTLKRWDAAAIFALALANRCERPEVISFSSNQSYHHDPKGAKTKVWTPRRGESVLKSVERWGNDGYFLGGGTDTSAAVRKHYAGQRRVILLTDEQNGSAYEVGSDLPDSTFAFTANLAGYQKGHAPSGVGNKHVLGGLTDSMFRLIPTLESGDNGTWPWE